MNVRDLMELTGAALLTPDADLAREITGGYACDLLSWVMSHAQPGMAWMTVQAHMNVVAVASLVDLSCVLLCDGVRMEQDVLDRAALQGVAVLSSPLTAYELCGRMHGAGIGASPRL